MDKTLALVDQAAFLGEQATGATSVIQAVWIYDRGIDIDGLRRFHRYLQRGRLSRRIELSPLPFGRHHWVTPSDRPGLEIVIAPRSRAGLETWLHEQAGTPVDAERGPGWHLAMLPFTDGGAALSLVISHSLTDGVGLREALAEAVAGQEDPVSWPATGSRGRWRAMIEDARQTARDLPDVGRALRLAIRSARRGDTQAGAAPRARFTGPDERVTVPSTTVFIDADTWDARATAAGGTANTLLVGLATRLAQRLGRVAMDGSVDLTMPVDDRRPGETRANAITNVDFSAQPPATTADLRALRVTVKQALIRNQRVPNERWALLPLTPLTPKWLVRRMVAMSAGSATSVVSSNLGEINPAANRAPEITCELASSIAEIVSEIPGSAAHVGWTSMPKPRVPSA